MTPSADIARIPDGPCALFLDVDGTLIEIAPTPSAVVVEPGLPPLLARLAHRLEGALALVSGRPVAALDELFHPYRFAAAGIHGLERRDAGGHWHFVGASPEALEPARAVLRAAVERMPRFLFEDKGRSVALHYRLAPEQEEAAFAAVREAAALAPPDVHVQRGHYVVELKSRAATKGTAVERFMEEAPFRGRTPLVIGDDITDEDAFSYAESVGGKAIEVGHRRPAGENDAPARHVLPDPRAVRAWLRALTETIR